MEYGAWGLGIISPVAREVKLERIKKQAGNNC